MGDRYIVREETTDTGFIYILTETGFKETTLGRYPSKSQAEKSKAEWIARDNLSDEIADFFTSALSKYGTILDESEIREMVKEYS